MRHSAKTVGALIVAVLLLANGSFGGIVPLRRAADGVVGVKGGMISRAHFELNADRSQTRIGSSFGMFFDLPVHKNLYSGVSFDLHNILIYGQREFMIDAALVFKYSHEYKRLRMALKPAVSVGYGGLPSYDFMRRTDYLTLKAFVELHFLLPRMHSWIIELGVFAAPVGGNRSDDVTIEPAAMLRVGYII